MYTNFAFLSNLNCLHGIFSRSKEKTGILIGTFNDLIVELYGNEAPYFTKYRHFAIIT